MIATQELPVRDSFEYLPEDIVTVCETLVALNCARALLSERIRLNDRGLTLNEVARMAVKIQLIPPLEISLLGSLTRLRSQYDRLRNSTEPMLWSTVAAMEDERGDMFFLHPGGGGVPANPRPLVARFTGFAIPQPGLGPQELFIAGISEHGTVWAQPTLKNFE